jgi:hypothetical protein
LINLEKITRYTLAIYIKSICKYCVSNIKINFAGAYAEWINSHADVLRQVVPILVLGLVSADSAPSATMALKDLTRDCQGCMRPFADLILQASKVRRHCF